MIAIVLGAGLFVLLVGAGCASTGEARDASSDAEWSGSLDGAGQDAESRVRVRIEESVRTARDELAAIEAAQESVESATEHLLDVLDRAPEGETRDALLARVQEERNRAARIRERTQSAARRIDEFDERAAATLAAGETPGPDDSGRSDSLDALQGDSKELRNLLAPLVSSSDDLVRDISLLSTEVESLRRPGDGAAVAGIVAAPTAAAVDLAPLPDRPQTSEFVAELTTSKGVIVLEFYDELAPRHVQNFFALARDGFYDGLTFHRVVPGFVVQAGCPEGTGAGGPGWELENEFNDQRHVRGTLSMARMAHPDSAGSQFFICLDEWRELDGKYTVFGRMIRGEATLAAIEKVGTVSGVPVDPVTIESIELRERRPGDRDGNS